MTRSLKRELILPCDEYKLGILQSSVDFINLCLENALTNIHEISVCSGILESNGVVVSKKESVKLIISKWTVSLDHMSALPCDGFWTGAMELKFMIRINVRLIKSLMNLSNQFLRQLI